ncbi:MAG: hypothetical protein AVDCRST_MAG07-2352, partial [uncultured Frankineae bacterium]
DRSACRPAQRRGPRTRAQAPARDPARHVPARQRGRAAVPHRPHDRARGGLPAAQPRPGHRRPPHAARLARAVRAGHV